MERSFIVFVLALACALSTMAAAQPFPATRDPLKWPFAQNSIWNMPIGSSAVYQAAGILHNSNSGSPTEFVQDQDVVVQAPAAPATDVYYNGAGWSGADRCPSQGSKLQTVPVPADYVLPNSGENNSASFLMADGHTVKQNQPFTRCTAASSATSLVTFADEDLYGAGIYGAHGGSNLSALGGTIRLGEFTAGVIRHVMKVNLWAKEYYHCCTPHWPARVVDGYADATTYGGANVNFGPGSLLALLPSFDVNTLATAPGKILGQAFKDYGAYVVDDTYWNAWAIIAEQGPNGRVVDEFQGLYGFPMHPSQAHAFMTDMKLIFQSLRIVTNSSSAAMGGGGTPRQPLAPPFATVNVSAAPARGHDGAARIARLTTAGGRNLPRVAVVEPNGRMIDVRGKSLTDH